MGQNVLHGVGVAHHVHVEHPLPVGSGDVLHLAEHEGGGVVGEDIDGTEGSDSGLHRTFQVGLNGYVGRHEDGLAARGADVGPHGFTASAVDIHNHHPGAFGGEQLADGPPNARGTAGDDCRFTFQSHGHG